jgi:hypothetical protein
VRFVKGKRGGKCPKCRETRDVEFEANGTATFSCCCRRELPEETWSWSYPVYLLGDESGCACITDSAGGVTGNWLVVFTDSDLAERAVAATNDFVAIPVPDRRAFADTVSSLSADMAGAAFDPPTLFTVGSARMYLSRQELLSHL